MECDGQGEARPAATKALWVEQVHRSSAGKPEGCRFLTSTPVRLQPVTVASRRAIPVRKVTVP